MSEVKLTVHPFRMGADKEASLKPLEEAAEVFGAFQCFESYVVPASTPAGGAFAVMDSMLDDLADELADCIQACVNLADRYHIDLQTAMERCEKRNREGGRYE